MSISSVQHSVNTPVKDEIKKQEVNKSQVNSVLAVGVLVIDCTAMG